MDELWLADSDIVLVPKTELLVIDEYIHLLFTNGVYSVVPFNLQMSVLRTL
jgi:hypothetical protein